jgi:hypothetical protein
MVAIAIDEMEETLVLEVFLWFSEGPPQLS